MLLVGNSEMKAPGKQMRDKKEMIHYDKAGPDEFRSDEEVREQIVKFRAGSVGRIRAADIRIRKKEKT